MTARTVVGTLEFPVGSGSPCVGARISAELYTGVDGTTAYGTDSGDRPVGSTADLSDNGGAWSLDLEPNSSISPAGTVWLITEEPPDRAATTYYIEVPNTAGPHEVTDLLAEQPGALPSQALAAHAALTAAHGATGAVVGTTNTQTLTNKTLTSPTLTSPTITSPTITSPTITGGLAVDQGGTGSTTAAAARAALDAQRIFAVDVRDSATGDGVADDAAALNALMVEGSRVRFGRQSYLVASTVAQASNSVIEGVSVGVRLTASFDFGSRLLWGGATDGVLFSQFGVKAATVEHMCFDGAQTSGVTGILYDSINAPGAESCALRDIWVARCWRGLSISVDSAADYQADKNQLERAYFQKCETAVRIESANSAYSANFTDVAVSQHGIGFDLVDHGNIAIRNCVFGGHQSPIVPFTADILVTSGSNILVENCQTEDKTTAADVDQWFLHVPASASPDQRGLITLIGNRINDVGIKIEQTKCLVMIGNQMHNCNVVLDDDAGYPSVTSLRNNFSGDGIRTVTDGVLNATTTITSATASFLARDAGKRITGVGIPRGTTVVSVTNSTTVEISQAATTSASGVTLRFDYGFVVRRGQVLELSPNLNLAAPLFTVNSTVDGEVLRVESDAADPRNTGIGIRNAATGGQTWVLESSGPSGRSGTGGFGIYNSTAAVLPFRIDSDAPAGSIRLRNTGGVLAGGDVEIDGALNHDGSTVGFYGTAPVAKQTGVAVSAAAIHAALVSLGLISA